MNELSKVEAATDTTPEPVVIPVEAYISEDYARAERDKLWRKCWLQAGRVEDLPEVGSYITYEILDDSVLIVRVAEGEAANGAEGKIKAYRNVCTHRGRRLVDMVWEDLKPSDIVTEKAVENAITTVVAMGGSTNAVVHLVAMARRAGVNLNLDTFDAISRRTPFLANIRPSGKYIMEDFHYAGGIRALLAELGDLLHRDCMTANGRTLGDNLEGARIVNDDVIRPQVNALSKEGGLAILRGSLAPDGAVIKHSAADPKFWKHTGPAVVFKDYNDMARRIDDVNLNVTADSVLVLQSAGPKGGPGIPEWGMLPIPQKLLKEGVRDMVRISDARMSGTSYGTCVLHVAPESHVGGPLAFVQDGDLIELDVAERKLNLLVPEAEMAKRKAAWTPPKEHYQRGYGAIFQNHITQADKGCDFDILEAGEPTPEPEIH